MLAIRSDHKVRYLTISFIFLWQVSRQHIWRGCANDRARENDYVHGTVQHFMAFSPYLHAERGY